MNALSDGMNNVSHFDVRRSSTRWAVAATDDGRRRIGGRHKAARTPTGKRKKFSAAVRRKMALAQKARWAKIKGESEPAAPAPAEVPKAKRKLSAAAKAKLAANLKKARAAKAAKAKEAAKK